MAQSIVGLENVQPYKFSECSKKDYIDQLRTGHGLCLLNKPNEVSTFFGCGRVNVVVVFVFQLSKYEKYVKNIPGVKYMLISDVYTQQMPLVDDIFFLNIYILIYALHSYILVYVCTGVCVCVNSEHCSENLIYIFFFKFN